MDESSIVTGINAKLNSAILCAKRKEKKEKKTNLRFKNKNTFSNPLSQTHTHKVLQPTTALIIYKAILNKIQINSFVPCMEILCV